MNDNAYQELMHKAATDDEFRGKLLADPRSTLEAVLGVNLPAGLTVRIVENSPSELTLVIPPAVSSELDDDQLEAIAGGKSARQSGDVALSLMTFGWGCLASLAVEKSVAGCRKTLNPDLKS